ncbi:MAG: CheR family methyltransferase [Paracoccaceae bacterium]
MEDAISATEFEDDSFRALAELAYTESRLKLSKEKAAMVRSRLRHRLHRLSLPDFRCYQEFVCSPEGVDERRFMISALTTNVSSFFREAHHFDLLTAYVSETLARNGRTRIWSAGCANGQEPYSIAIHLLNTLPNVDSADVRILATDIDSKAVQFAIQGVYPAHMIEGIVQSDREKHFDPIASDTFRILPSVSRLILFKELNLFEDWPMKGSFDLIFCRNVVIYFDNATQEWLWPRFHNVLSSEGRLLLGHSERISDTERFGFGHLGNTTYKKLNQWRKPL